MTLFRLKLLFFSHMLCQKYIKFYLRVKESSMTHFGGEKFISVNETLNHLNYHDVVISGGSLGRILPSRHCYCLFQTFDFFLLFKESSLAHLGREESVTII